MGCVRPSVRSLLSLRRSDILLHFFLRAAVRAAKRRSPKPFFSHSLASSSHKGGRRNGLHKNGGGGTKRTHTHTPSISHTRHCIHVLASPSPTGFEKRGKERKGTERGSSRCMYVLVCMQWWPSSLFPFPFFERVFCGAAGCERSKRNGGICSERLSPKFEEGEAGKVAAAAATATATAKLLPATRGISRRRWRRAYVR